jgi:hypothetical protein
MTGHSQVLDQRQVFVSTDPVPSRSVAVLSVLAHLLVVTGIVALAHMPRGRIVAQKYFVTNISGTPQLAFSPPTAKGSSRHLSLPRMHRSAQMAPVPEVGATEGTASETLQEHAREATAGMVIDLKQRQIYGFSLGAYEIPVWVSGDLPTISAAEVPSHFEQLLIVEITIDVDGSVAQATIVSGSIAPSIQHKLLSAILGFKYNPAKRGGTPIPSQMDLVVHVPS